MQRIVRDEIGEGEALFNYLHPDLRFMRSGRKMELDMWFPERMLAIEYQGEYHDTPRGKAGTAMADLELRRQMDAEKRAACAQAGITLIEIWHHQVKDRHDIIRTILREALSGYKAPVSLLMPHPRATG
jgi:very-short-patch-repair endonuclease